MSKKTKYLTEEDLKKFDTFIQESLNKYFYVDTWDKLTSNTGKDSYDIISYKSTIPDLVIYNKTFNKSKCFLHSNKNTKFIKFPRIQFLLRPKKIKNYNPSNTYGIEEKKENDISEEEKTLEPFEFKSIPKEIEDKYNNINNNNENIKKNNITENNNQLFDELKDFMKSDKDNDNENKVKIIKENENQINQVNQISQSDQYSEEQRKQEDKKKENDKHKDNNKKNKDNNKNRKYSNNRNYPKNKFESPLNINNMNNMNNMNSMNNFINFNNMNNFNNFNNVNNINNKNVNINPNMNMNMNNFSYNNNNFLDIQNRKMMQYIQFQNYMKALGMYNLNNSNQINKFNQMPNNGNNHIKKNENINNNNNINNYQINDKNINNNNPNNNQINDKNNNIINTVNPNNDNNLNSIQYFQNNNLSERQDIEKIMSDIDYFFKKNENKRGWKVVDKNNIIVNKFNNEQLFFFLNTINNRDGDKNFFITDLDDDILFNPLDIYEHLKEKYEK